jgi:hypothetical protein
MSKAGWEYPPFRARFEPKRRDDLKPGIERWIGYEGEWQRLWSIEEEDGGSYVGDWAVGPSADEQERSDSENIPLYPYIWVPECDLVKL